jgi:F-type H+-transporting ATPase subunit b
MKRTAAWFAFWLPLAVAAPALAEGGFFAEHKTLIENVVALINFLIFAYILVRFAGPKLRAYFDHNADEYRAKVEEAARVLAEAQQVHAEWQARRAQLEEELAQYKKDALHLADAQAAEVLGAARQTATRIVSEAQRTAEGNLVRAKEELRAELVEALLQKTEEKLLARLSTSHQHMLIEEAIKKLEASR